MSKIEETAAIYIDRYRLRNIIERLAQRYDGKNGRKRPDLILKRNREDFVLIELKAPDVMVTMVEVEQALDYKREISEYHPEARGMDVYIVGRKYNDVVKDQYFEGNPQRVHVLSLSAIFQQASDRIAWLSKSLEDEYEYASSSLGSETLLPEFMAAEQTTRGAN